jgi:hypothetical protein
VREKFPHPIHLKGGLLKKERKEKNKIALYYIKRK